MQNFFQCNRCGANNRMGVTACINCGLQFQYSCPNCRLPVKGGDATCGKCGYALAWPSPDIERKMSSRQNVKKVTGKSSNSWVLPLVGVVLVLAIAAAGVYVLVKLNEKPVAPLSIDQPAQQVQPQYIKPDTYPPAIRDINVRNINENSVAITWTTDEESTTQLVWHMREGSTMTTARKDALVLQHSEDLIDLKMNTTYYFKVISADRLNNEATSEERSFMIGKEAGATKVDLQMHTMTIEEQPSGTRTLIRGQIINSGDYPVKISDIQVLITISVPGKMSAGEINADLDPAPEVMNAGDTHKFVAVVPNGTSPVYTITIKVANP